MHKKTLFNSFENILQRISNEKMILQQCFVLAWIMDMY